jgi:hypothetical protein
MRITLAHCYGLYSYTILIRCMQHLNIRIISLYPQSLSIEWSFDSLLHIVTRTKFVSQSILGKAHGQVSRGIRIKRSQRLSYVICVYHM